MGVIPLKNVEEAQEPCIDCPVWKAYSELAINIAAGQPGADEEQDITKYEDSSLHDLRTDDVIKFFELGIANRLNEDFNVGRRALLDGHTCNRPKRRLYMTGLTPKMKLGRVCSGKLVTVETDN